MDEGAQDELKELLEAIRGYGDPRRASTEWKRVYRALGKTDLPERRYQSIVGIRDVKALGALIEELADPAGGPTEAPPPDPAVCKRALHAFRKRARLTQLDDESQLGRSPLSKGGDERLGAIAPPTEWPAEVWQELVRQGKLRYVGHGMYELPK